MDITVAPTDDGRAWTLTDLLGRPMGRITEGSAQQFTIHPEGHTRETIAGIEHGPFACLDAANPQQWGEIAPSAGNLTCERRYNRADHTRRLEPDFHVAVQLLR